MNPAAAATDPAPPVDIRGLSKWFGDFQVLADIDLTIHKSDRVVICGPSGSGKSTLIRTINALESFQKGEIRVNGAPPSPSPACGSAWCSRRSTCFRTSPCWKTAPCRCGW